MTISYMSHVLIILPYILYLIPIPSLWPLMEDPVGPTCSSKDSTRVCICVRACCATALWASGSSLFRSDAKRWRSWREATRGTSSVTTAWKERHVLKKNESRYFFVLFFLDVWKYNRSWKSENNGKKVVYEWALCTLFLSVIHWITLNTLNYYIRIKYCKYDQRWRYE